MMNRREAIQRVALLIGGTFSAPTLLAMENWDNTKNASGRAINLSDQQKLIIAEVAEMIIPKTSTPGAKDAGVPEFIVMMLRDCYKTPEQTIFSEGIQDLEKKGFLESDAAKRVELLTQIESDAARQIAAASKVLPYWRLMKELTMLGYFTSEQGIRSSFDYTPIPGKLEMIQLKPNQKSFAY
ncbi:gluconate 2-dehydrogenase subunit 3 family protein [Dyadobacter linearis]|nr:gluconate 2-dehydrogenase subunit 3 family protein [Dyadobacter sp. CECT 9623]